VALGSPYWLQPAPEGLLGVDNAGLLSVCYAGPSLPVFEAMEGLDQASREELLTRLEVARREWGSGNFTEPADIDVQVLAELVSSFPKSDGCTRVLQLPAVQGALLFYRALPFPSGANLNNYQMAVIGLVAFFCLFSAFLCVSFTLIACLQGSVRRNAAILHVLSGLQVVCGAVAVIVFLVMCDKILAQVRYSDGRIDISNIAVSVEDQPWRVGLLDILGWAFWLFVAAEVWAIVSWPGLCIAVAVSRARSLSRGGSSQLLGDGALPMSPTSPGSGEYHEYVQYTGKTPVAQNRDSDSEIYTQGSET
jgi:hypothetical protein